VDFAKKGIVTLKQWLFKKRQAVLYNGNAKNVANFAMWKITIFATALNSPLYALRAINNSHVSGIIILTTYINVITVVSLLN